MQHEDAVALIENVKHFMNITDNDKLHIQSLTINATKHDTIAIALCYKKDGELSGIYEEFDPDVIDDEAPRR